VNTNLKAALSRAKDSRQTFVAGDGTELSSFAVSP